MFMRQMILTSIVALSLTASSARGDERYFLVMFGAQAEPNLPRFAHSFATFVKASGNGQFPKDYKIETKTISWLPAKLTVQPLLRTPVPGKNLDLAATLAWAKAEARVTAWGPFEVKKELYDQAVKQIERLESGKLAYIALDGRSRGAGAVNCIHALSDLDAKQAALNTGTAHGNAASLLVLGHFAKWLVNPEMDHRWLRDRLVLNDQVRWQEVEKAGSP
jgi:hypothetical protein